MGDWIAVLKSIKRWLLGGESRHDDPMSARTRSLPEQRDRSQRKGISDAYFEAMAKVQGAIAQHDYERASKMVRKSMELIPGWVHEQVRDYGAFQIGSIPALEQGGIMLALVGDRDGLSKMHDLVCSIPELARWEEVVIEHQSERSFRASAHPTRRNIAAK